MTTPTPPVGSARPGNRTLLGATAALAVALAAALATGVLHQSSQPGSCAAPRVPVAMRAMDTATAYSIGDTVFVAPIKLWPPDSASRAGLVVPADSSALFSSIIPNADSTGFYVIVDSGRTVARAAYCAMVPAAFRAEIVSTMPDDTSAFPPPGAVH